MNKFMIVLILIFALSAVAGADEPPMLPQPIFHQVNFLQLPDIAELNLDYCLQWTDSIAGLFLQPYDAVVLHVAVNGTMKDVFIFSDAAFNRLEIWQCSEPINGERNLESITVYDGEDAGYFHAPKGMDTNAKNRIFDPNNDLIYVADSRNGRIIELSYSPDTSGGQLHFNRSIGEGYLERPVDVAISAYGDNNLGNVDLYVADEGEAINGGKLHRFNLTGSHEGAWRDCYYPGSQTVIGSLFWPVSVACFPDTEANHTAIFISEKYNATIFYLTSTTNGDPIWRTNFDVERDTAFEQSGGVACDDYGRIYVTNVATGKIEIYGPSMYYVDDFYGQFGEGAGQLYYPNNIVIDTYHNQCEAIVFEQYYRQSGFQSFIIENGSSLSKPSLGFIGSNLIRPVNQEQGTLPITYSLNEAYPNPFNSDCLIKYSMPGKSHVTIDIYNILGQKVTRLVDADKEAGEYAVQFNAKGLASGTYLYKMTAGDYSKTKMVALVK